MFPSSPHRLWTGGCKTRWLIALLISVVLDGGGLILAQEKETPESLNSIFQNGMAAFNSGDFPTAIANLSKLTDQVPEAQLEPIYFTLAGAYFNTKNYPKAIELFQIYLAKFPQSARIPDVTFALAQSYLATGNTNLATSLAKNLEANPLYREQALFFRATASRSVNNLDDAIAALVTLVGDSIKTKMGAKGAMLLASISVEKGDNDKAAALFGDLQKHLDLVENVVGLNSLAIELGDQLLAKEAYSTALACYRAARSKEEVVRIQRDRISDMEMQVEANLAAGRGNLPDLARYLSLNQQIRTEIETARKLLEQFEKLPSTLSAIYMRMARCYYEDKRRWEAIVVYEELLKRISDGPDRELAMYALVVTYGEVNQPKIAGAKCDAYLKEYPNGPNVATVSYLRGAMALQAQDFSEAETWFGSVLETQPQNTMREQIRLLLGNSQFGQGKYDEAITQYREYLKEFPNGGSAEESEYRIAMAQLFGGKYEETLVSLNTYLQKHPQGSFVADAKYRLLVCNYAAEDYEKVLGGCANWQKEFPDYEQTGEVLSLKADALAATEKVDEAIATYIKASKLAATDEVLNYTLFEASKWLQKKGEWDKVAALFEEFVQEKPTHPTAVAALFWIGKARARLGMVEEAKKFLATTIKKYIDDPAREPVEQMITQLVQLCAKKQRAVEPDPEIVNPSPTPAIDPSAELDALLGVSSGSATAKARILFAKAELAALRKQPDLQKKYLSEIISGTPVEALSPTLLARLGDVLLQNAELDKAAAFYLELKDLYPKSDVVDFAYSGLGQIHFGKSEFVEALKLFSYGTDKIAAAQKLKDITLGKARTLLALGRFDEAKPLFEQVASVREWRGDATAESVYSLGQIEWKQGRWPEANAYFQRVFVGYQKFTPWAAKAYVASGDSFEKMGKTQEARNTYQEMLRQDKFIALPEAETARKRLKEIGQG